MYEEWPSERHAQERQVNVDNSVKTKQDFLALLSIFHNNLPKEFDDAAAWIAEHEGDLGELKQRVIPIISHFNLQTYPDGQSLLMTLVCAVALARAPTLKTWGRVNTFRYNSWELEHWLEKGMIAYVEVTPAAGHAYVELAREAFTGLNNFTLSSKSDRINNDRVNAWSYWNECQNKLDEIWWNLRRWPGFMNYAEEFPLFQLFYKLKPDEYIRTLSESSNPYLVSSLLFVAGIGSFSPRLSDWKRSIIAAPIAFEDDGKWNGSVLLPLLLMEAYNQLSNARDSLRNSANIEEIKQEITDTAELIAITLTERQDASSIISRWTPWLMRHVLSHKSKDVTDLNSSAFIADALIDSIGRKLNGIELPQISPKDAAAWESWSYKCVLSSFAYNEQIPVPSCESFIREWCINPEDWAGEKGKLLREHASLITSFHKEIPGMAVNLLAYPIVRLPSPEQEWIMLWKKTITLREIVEFGDSDVSSSEYGARSDAGQLLFLLFCIGLSIFDQGVARCSSSRSSEVDSMVNLYKELTSVLREMREIDSTLNHDKWLLAFQHLAVRRMIWQKLIDDEHESVNFHIFKPSDTPTLIDLLCEVKGDLIEFVATLQSVLLNGPNLSKLKEDLNLAMISLPDITNSIRRLSKFHPKKYPIDESQIKKLEEIAF